MEELFLQMSDAINYILNNLLPVIIEQLSIDAVPFIVLLIVPVLGRMSDHDQSVRLLATNVFATLVRLLPLEVSVAFSCCLLVKYVPLEVNVAVSRCLLVKYVIL